MFRQFVRCAVLLACPLLAAPEPDMLRAWLTGIANQQLAARRDAVAAIQTRAQLEKRQAETRAKLLKGIGGLPAAAPSLNVRKTGVVDRGSYRVEKLIFEGRPGVFITASLYVPQMGKGPFPAVLHSVGHSPAAKNRAFYQTTDIGLVRHGFVVLTIDPLGQGERVVFYDRQLGASKAGGPTTEHEMLGMQSLLAGESIARDFIRDGMRGIDVLAARPDVDAKRIGLTGCSGGGTLTTYLAVLDPRVAVAAPACYVTSWEEQLASGTGPQDAEQQFPDLLRAGLNHADLVEAFAPKPYLICSTDQDFFPLEGARRTFTEAKRMWTLAGAPERLDWFHEPGEHGTPTAERERIYGWMKQWLQGAPAGSAAEGKVVTEYEEALNATETGQVSTSLGGETSSTVNRRRYSAIRGQARDLRAAVLELTRAELGHSLAARELEATAEPVHFTYSPAPGRTVPAALMVPAKPRGKAVLYVSEEAAGAVFQPGSDADQLVKLGYTVLAMDVAGRGATAPKWAGYSLNWFGPLQKTSWLGLMVGRPLVGLHMEDIVGALDVLGAKQPVIGYGKGAGAVDLLHAAMVDSRLSMVLLEKMLVSYRAAATEPLHRNLPPLVVPGVLGKYDLPLLAASVAPRRVVVVNAQSAVGNTLPLMKARAAYPGKNIRVGLRREPDTITEAFPELR